MVTLVFKIVCPLFMSRNHVKGHHRPADVPTHSPSSLTLGALMDGLTGPLSPQPLQTPEPVSLLSFSFKDISLPANISSGDLSGGGRGRLVNYVLFVKIKRLFAV